MSRLDLRKELFRVVAGPPNTYLFVRGPRLYHPASHFHKQLDALDNCSLEAPPYSRSSRSSGDIIPGTSHRWPLATATVGPSYDTLYACLLSVFVDLVICMGRRADFCLTESQVETEPFKMASASARARSSTSGSTTSSRPRPISRASTTSIPTASAPPPQQYRQGSESAYLPPSHPQALQYTAEEMITRSEHQLTNPNQGYAIDPLLQDHASGTRAVSVDHVYDQTHDGMRPMSNHHYSYDSQGPPQFAAVNFQDDQTQDESGTGEMRKKKGSASSIANDQELRRLFAENKHRDLKDVASAVLANERGPKSEKTKQIFAMNW